MCGQKETTKMLTAPLPLCPASPISTFRRICSWCRCDLGPLWHGSQQHSYGICAACRDRYFAYLYEADGDLPLAQEELLVQAVGDPVRCMY
jgi:hypothetical protein